MEINFEIDWTNVRSDADAKRQAEWRDRSVQPIKAARAKRLQLLNRQREAILRATDAYIRLDEGDVPWIGLRNDFIARESATGPQVPDELEPVKPSREEHDRRRRRELLGRPPLTRLVHRQSNALSLYLTATYVAHLEVKAGNAFVNQRHNLHGSKATQFGWIWLAAMTIPKEERARRARMRRALDELVVARLVNIDTPGAPGRYENWTLLADDGTGAGYRVPSERGPDTIRLPASFFYNGWHLVLAPGEIVMLLAIIHRSKWAGAEAGLYPWISLPRYIRKATYGLSGEMYLHAQQLIEFGLVELRDPMPNRRRGKIKPERVAKILPDADDKTKDVEDKLHPVPYDFRLAESTVFNQNAFTLAHKTLSALPIPHRLDSEGALISPQDYVEIRLKAK